MVKQFKLLDNADLYYLWQCHLETYTFKSGM